MRYSELSRKTPIPFKQMFLDWVVSEGMGASYNSHRIQIAWEECSGYGNWTTSVFFKNGLLYLSLNCSSVIKTQIRLQSEQLTEEINKRLKEDEMFIKNKAFTRYVDKIIIK